MTVGGSGVGSDLLRRLIDACPQAASKVPGLRMLVVAGPRIDPATLPSRGGVEVRAYVPHLYRHLAASDLAIVQGGLTTCMELTAARPFIYIPLRQHFEQTFHVHHRLQARRAGGRGLRRDTTRHPRGSHRPPDRAGPRLPTPSNATARSDRQQPSPTSLRGLPAPASVPRAAAAHKWPTPTNAAPPWCRSERATLGYLPLSRGDRDQDAERQPELGTLCSLCPRGDRHQARARIELFAAWRSGFLCALTLCSHRFWPLRWLQMGERASPGFQ